MNSSTQKLTWYKDEERVFGFLFGSIAASLIFWPLLNSICCILTFIYWLVFVNKRFHAGETRGRFMILCCLLYILALIGSLYSHNKAEAVFKLQQKIPLLIFPLIAATSTSVNARTVNKTLSIFTWSTLAGCMVSIIIGTYYYLLLPDVSYPYGYTLIVLKDMHPVVMGLC